MGNPLSKNNCCSNQFGHNKQEVDIEEDINGRANSTANLPDRKGYQTAPDDKQAAQLQRNHTSKPEVKTKEENIKDAERIKHLERICSRAPRLILRVVNSTTLPKGTLIKINAQGVEGSLRNRKDGITYFGCKKKSKTFDESLEEPIEVLNDYVIRNKDPEINDRHRGRHFQIEYSIESNIYKIRDLGIGFGAFVKIENPLLLRDNNLLSMGSSFLIVNFDEDQNKNSLVYSNSQDLQDKIHEARLSRQSPFNSPLFGDNRIKLQNTNGRKAGTQSEITVKIFGGPNYGEVYQFTQTMPTIKIGRMPDCEIRIDDNLLSKYQASIKYEPDSGWTLYDGYNDKPSTNSNWLYLNDDFEVFNGMVFKANHTLFETIIENSVAQ